MTGLALVLVFTSALAHASWNFLLKRAGNHEVFSWSLLVAVAALLLPLAVVLALLDPIVQPGWWFVLGTSIIHVFYFMLLGRGYSRADLSLVYPVARGVGPALVPVAGVLVLRENIASLAIIGIITVVLGIYVVYWSGRVSQLVTDPLQLLRDPGTRFALLTGLVITIYSVWDKVGVRYVNPFLYMYLLSAGTGIWLVPYILRFHGAQAVLSEWKNNWRYIVIGGLLMFLAYSFILIALRFTRVSYVVPSREIGIVIGVLLGSLVLKESFGKRRFLGSSFIVLGVVLISLSR